jgi:protein-tyrosine phosphatase
LSSWFRTYGYAEILNRLLIGAFPTDEKDVAMLGWVGITRILNLVEDSEYRPGERRVVQAALQRAGIEEARIGLADYGSLPPTEVEAAVRTVNAWLDQGAHAYVHCRAGWQRSAAIAAGVVALRNGLEIDEAMAFVKRAKPSADPLDHQRDDLRRWWADRPRTTKPG